MTRRVRPWLIPLGLCFAWLLALLVPIPGSANPEKVTKRLIYYSDLDANRVYVVSAKFRKKPKIKLARTFEGIPSPWGVALDPDEDFLLVANHRQNTVSRVGLPSGRILATTRVGKRPTDIGLMPSGDYAFILNSKGKSMSVYDTRTDTVIDTIPLKKVPLRLDVNDRGTSVYVANVKSDVISKVNARAAVGLDNNPVQPVVQHINRRGACDVSGGITSVRFPGRIPSTRSSGPAASALPPPRHREPGRRWGPSRTTMSRTVRATRARTATRRTPTATTAMTAVGPARPRRLDRYGWDR